jgi:hemoglobin
MTIATTRPDADWPAQVPGEADIRRLVHAFYARARTDALLGPIFESTVGDWAVHLDILVRFWCSVLRRTGTYRGNPMAAHHPLGLGDQHFARWLALWDATARETLSPEQARHVFETAQRIGRSLRIGLDIDPLRRERRAAGGGCTHRHSPAGSPDGQPT